MKSITPASDTPESCRVTEYQCRSACIPLSRPPLEYRRIPRPSFTGGGAKPARSTVQVAALPKGAHVEIELVAEV